MKKIILSILFLFLFIIAYFISGHLGREAVRYFIKSPQLTDQEIEQQAIQGFKSSLDELNATLPYKINEDTQIDHATVGPGARLTYHYTFLKYTSKEIDINWLNNGLKKDIIKQVCGSEDMKASLRYNAIYAYSYSGKNGNYIDKFEVTRKDCGYSKLTY